MRVRPFSSSCRRYYENCIYLNIRHVFNKYYGIQMKLQRMFWCIFSLHYFECVAWIYVQKSWNKIENMKEEEEEKSNTRNRKKIQVSRVCKCSRWRSFPYHIRSFCNFVHTYRAKARERAKHLPNFHICLCIFHIFLFCIPFAHEYFISLHSLILAFIPSLSFSLSLTPAALIRYSLTLNVPFS